MRWRQVRLFRSVDVIIVIEHEVNFELIRNSDCGRQEGQTPRAADKLRTHLAKLSFDGITLYISDRMV